MECDVFSSEGSIGQRFWQSQKRSSMRNKVNTFVPCLDMVSTVTKKCETHLWKITSECRHSNKRTFSNASVATDIFKVPLCRKSLLFHIELMSLSRKSPLSLQSHASAVGWVFFLILTQYCPWPWSHIDQTWCYFQKPKPPWENTTSQPCLIISFPKVMLHI